MRGIKPQLRYVGAENVTFTFKGVALSLDEGAALGGETAVLAAADGGAGNLLRPVDRVEGFDRAVVKALRLGGRFKGSPLCFLYPVGKRSKCRGSV